MIKLLHGDCLELMQDLGENSIDLVLTDPPYGTTACKWDSIIPLDKMWKLLHEPKKDNVPVVLFGIEPFSSYLRMSNIDQFKYDWIWHKNMVSGVAQAKNKPITTHELIHVFSEGATVHASQTARRVPYNPQGLIEINKTMKNHTHDQIKAGGIGQRPSHKKTYVQTHTNYPKSILYFDCVNRSDSLHPTQKPVALMEYLISTYTNEGDTVLDFCMGSGTTGIACKNLNRNFIGIEKDEEYFKIAKDRIENHQVD